jgi:hypothetical protein
MKGLGFEGEAPRHPREGLGINRLWDSLKTLPKLQVVDPENDHEVIGRVRHVMVKNEKLMEFYARTGLGRAQILRMSRDEISSFVERAVANRMNEFVPPAVRVRAEPAVRQRPIAMVG